MKVLILVFGVFGFSLSGALYAQGSSDLAREAARQSCVAYAEMDGVPAEELDDYLADCIELEMEANAQDYPDDDSDSDDDEDESY